MQFTQTRVVHSEIVFKKINPEDFNPYGFNARIDYIIPTEEGYISEQVKSVLDFEETNTVVLNAGVGQGKTHTILDIAKYYYENGFVIVFAVPYKSLIDQYLDDLTGDARNIPINDIADYREISYSVKTQEIEDDEIEVQEPITPIEAALKTIHLITVNSLLGNPGDEFIQQSKAKSEYINLLIDNCKKHNQKVVFIFDEIHDSIQNFKQQFIFRLLNWHKVTHKVFCISATYNEASKVVIKYLCLLTKKTIQIIESQRIKFEFKQSDLYLLLYNKQHYYPDDDVLIKVFQFLIETNKRINVLSYSKTIAENLASKDGKVGKLLIEKFGSINLCISSSNNVFDSKQCNIGTTFSTGINIRGNDSAFVVILPSKFSYEQRRLGVFSRGINTLIQALARIRDKSEIYIITPSPKFLIMKDECDDAYIKNVKKLSYFDEIEIKESYHDLNGQRALIKKKYDLLIRGSEDGIKYAKTLPQTIDNPSLIFPTLDDYTLSTGEKVLTTYYEIFGKDLSIYTFWAAFNDQFINCRLKGVSVLSQLVLQEGKIMEGLRDFAYSEFFSFVPEHNNYSTYYFSIVSDRDCYEGFRNAIFSNEVIFKKGNSKKIIKPNRNSAIEKYIIATVQLIKKENAHFKEKYNVNYVHNSSTSIELNDVEYTIREYFFSCFKSVEKAKNTTEAFKDDERKLIDSYNMLYTFYRDFSNLFTRVDSANKRYFEPKLLDNYKANSKWRELHDAIFYVLEKDPAIVNHAFNPFQKLFKGITFSAFVTIVYNFFKKTFYKTKQERVKIDKSEVNNKRDVIVEEYQMPRDNLINLIYNSGYDWFEDVKTFNGIVEDIEYSEGHPEQDYV